MQLIMPYIQRIDQRCAPAQADVGEAAGACADIEHDALMQRDAKIIQYAVELRAGAGDEVIFLFYDFDMICLTDLKAVLGDELSIDPHTFFPDGILRPASGLQHLAQCLIEPHAHSSSSSLNSVFMSIFSARRSCGMLPCST